MTSLITTGIIYMIFGIIFIFFAVQQVILKGWNLFAYLLVFIAALDCGSAIKLFFRYFQLKKENHHDQ